MSQCSIYSHGGGDKGMLYLLHIYILPNYQISNQQFKFIGNIPILNRQFQVDYHNHMTNKRTKLLY